MMLFSLKEAFWTVKTTFYYSLKISIFLKGFRSKIANIFRAYFTVIERLFWSFDDVFFSKGGFLDDKNDILL